MDLTKRQQEIFDFIKSYSSKHGYPPTVRDIGAAVGLASSSTVHAHLANLEKLGLLKRDPSKPRAIELLDRALDPIRNLVRPEGLPILGAVAAGQPILAEENIEEYVQVPQAAGGEDGEYILRVRALARAVAQSYLQARAKLGFPMAPADLRDEVLAKLEAAE